LIRLPDVTRQKSGIRHQGSENQPIPKTRRPIQNPGPALELDSYQDQNFPTPHRSNRSRARRESSKKTRSTMTKNKPPIPITGIRHQGQQNPRCQKPAPKTCQTNHPATKPTDP
jgi:hypothetical protein